MKYLRLLIFSSFLCNFTVFSQESDVTIYYYERLPFFGQANTENEGIILEITRQVFETAEIPYHFERMPVARIFEILKTSNDNVCFPGVFRNQERERLYIFSDASIYQDTSPHYVIRRSDEAYFNGIDTIRDLLRTTKKVGLVEKYSYGMWIDDNIKKYQPDSILVNIGDDQKNFYKMLLLNRFDYFFASTEEANYVIRSNTDYVNNLLLKTLLDAPEGNIRWIIFNRGFKPELIRRINKAIPLVKESARYKMLVNQMIK